MNVIKRLQRLTGDSPRKTEKRDHHTEIAALRKRIDMIMARRPKGSPPSSIPPDRRSLSLAAVIPGEDHCNDSGTCFVQESFFDASAWHGHCRVGDFAGLDMQTAAALAANPALAECRLEEGLFLDTETTGLSGGTGTMAFLIGLGWFDRGHFIVRQIFARDFSEERAALVHLSDIIRTRRFLVSFNGKTFDVGLLSTRFIMNRMQSPFPELPHLDLLYPARRLIAHRLENCRLATLEERVLGLVRQDDVPGSEIPQRYFDWLRRGDARPLRDIFTHNRLDIVSLAALMRHLTELIHCSCDSIQTDTRDLLAVARWHSEQPDQVPVAESLLTSLTQSTRFADRMEARKMLSLIHKRANRWEDAMCLWQQMVRDDPRNRFALIELAKWYEHRAHDSAAALNLVNQALQYADERISPREKDALLHRKQRLRHWLAEHAEK